MKLDKHSIPLFLLLTVIFIAGTGIGYVFSTSSSTFTISSGIYPNADYTVYKEGTTYYAKNAYGHLTYSNTNASYVINSALNALTVDRTWQEKVLIKGNIILTSTIYISGYTILEIQGNITLANNANHDMIRNKNPTTGNQFIEIYGGILNGNKDGNTHTAGTTGWDGIHFSWVGRSHIHDIYICDIDGDAIFWEKGSAGDYYGIDILENLFITNIDERGIYFNGMADTQIFHVETIGCGLDTSIAGIRLQGIFFSSCGSIHLDTIRSDFNGYGLTISDGHGFYITNVNIWYNYYVGINIDGTSNNIKMSLGNVADNSKVGATQFDGISITDSGNITISDFNVNNYDAITQNWGIKEYGTSDYNIISLVSAFKNIVGGIYKIGTHSQVHLCYNGTSWIS